MQLNLKQIKSASDKNKYAECRIYHEMHFSLLCWVFPLFLNFAGGKIEGKS